MCVWLLCLREGHTVANYSIQLRGLANEIWNYGKRLIKITRRCEHAHKHAILPSLASSATGHWYRETEKWAEYHIVNTHTRMLTHLYDEGNYRSRHRESVNRLLSPAHMEVSLCSETESSLHTPSLWGSGHFSHTKKLTAALINCHRAALRESDSNTVYLKSPTIVSLFTGVVNRSYLPDLVISLNFS